MGLSVFFIATDSDFLCTNWTAAHVDFFTVYVIFNDTVTIPDYTASDDTISELEGLRKEAVVA